MLSTENQYHLAAPRGMFFPNSGKSRHGDCSMGRATWVLYAAIFARHTPCVTGSVQVSVFVVRSTEAMPSQKLSGSQSFLVSEIS